MKIHGFTSVTKIWIYGSFIHKKSSIYFQSSPSPVLVLVTAHYISDYTEDQKDQYVDKLMISLLLYESVRRRGTTTL